MNGTYLTVISRLFFKKNNCGIDHVIFKNFMRKVICSGFHKSCMFNLTNFIKLKHKLNRKMLDMFLWDGIN